MWGVNMKKVIGVDAKLSVKQCLPLSFQHLFAMFGASILVPFLFGIDPSIVLLMNGIGTILFAIITKCKSPAFLGSSFAFLATGQIIIDKFGHNVLFGSFIVVGLVGCILALIIKYCGTKWIDNILPPASMGAIVSLIGLELVGSAANNAGLLDANVDYKNVIVFAITLITAIIASVFFKKFFNVISLLIAIVVGYISCLLLGIVDFKPVLEAPIVQMPQFGHPEFRLDAIMMMLPVLLVTSVEHIGHQIVTGNIIGKDLLKDPGLDRSLFADNFSTLLSGLLGSVPTTTYGENIGVMALTKVYSVRVILGAAILSIIFAFSGNIVALINSIPGPVIGGISFLLYGMIGVSGLRILIDHKVDYSNNKNLILTAVILSVGLSGICIKINELELKGMVLASICAFVMGITFYLISDVFKIKTSDDAFE